MAIAVTGALLVGGLTRIASQSGTYDADSNRSLAAQGGVVADQSNATAATVRALIAAMPSQTRQGLQAGLDSAVQQTSEESSRAALAAGSAAAGSLADQFAEVFAERAQAVSDYRAAIDGFLGMQPVPPAGTSNTVALAPSGTTLLSATAATDRITAAGALLARAVSLRQDLRFAYLDLGSVYTELHRYDEALAALQRAEKLGPGQIDVHFRLGTLYKAMGKSEDAKREFAKIHELQKKAEDDLADRMNSPKPAPQN